MSARAAALRGALGAALSLATGCAPDAPDLERMIVQRRYEPYAASSVFADGRAMRTPPEGTIPRGARIGDPLLESRSDAGFAATVPLRVDRTLLDAGRARFDVHCAPCHGLLGDGVSRVALYMTVRKPPSLVGAGASALPPGRIFEVISNGYGLMRSYADDVPALEERWAVAAYVGALQVAAGVPVASLPGNLRERAEEALR